MKRVSCFLIAIAAILIGSWSVSGEVKEKPGDDVSKLMKRKLAASEELLPALAEEDFAKLSKSADQLLKLAKEQWVADNTPEYQAQLKDFWVVLEGLKTSAQEKNLDGATLGYVQMTISCVKCHKYIRKRDQ
jgi:hypothetical protein